MRECDPVTDALAQGRPLGALLEAHVGRCRDCQALVAADRGIDTLTDAMEPADEEIPPALRAALRRDARPVAAFNAWRRVLPVTAAVMAMAALVHWAMPRADLAHQPGGRLALGLGVVISGLVVSLALLLHGGQRGLGLPARARWTSVAVAFAVFEVVTAMVTVPVEGSVHLAGAAAVAARLGCALHGALFAAVAGVLMFHGARRSAVVSPVAAGAVAGLGAGLVGALIQHLHCPVMDLDHTLVAHGAPLVVGVLLGALSGRRWLAP